MFDKIFKVRVEHAIDVYYVVTYSYARFINNYKRVMVWRNLGYESSQTGWGPKLMKYGEAEQFAKKLNSYQDVVEFYKKDEGRESEFYEAKEKYIKEWTLKNKPYETKQIR